jgi:hypothetical protein
MRGSKEAVEDWTGLPCRVFAYPYGRCGRGADIARRLFQISVTNESGWWDDSCDPALVPRVRVHEDMSSTTLLFRRRLVATR